MNQCNLCPGKTKIPIKGIDVACNKSGGIVTSDMTSRLDNFKTNVELHLLVFPRITHSKPSQCVNLHTINILTHIKD